MHKDPPYTNILDFAEIKKGDVILDLGSERGTNSFLAAEQTGPKGRVIGVDMNADMTKEAKVMAIKYGYKNVEFRLGTIENLPIADNSVDLILSNHIVNLSEDTNNVFKENFRVLKPGGKIILSTTVLQYKLPDDIEHIYGKCVKSALFMDDLIFAIRKAGFYKIRILEENKITIELVKNLPISAGVSFESLEKAVKSVLIVTIEAKKVLP